MDAFERFVVVNEDGEVEPEQTKVARGETAYLALTGYSDSEFVNDSPQGLVEISPEDARKFLAQMDKVKALSEDPDFDGLCSVKVFDYRLGYIDNFGSGDNPLVEAMSDARNIGTTVVLTKEQHDAVDAWADDNDRNIRTEIECLHVMANKIYWTCVIKHTSLDIASDAISRATLERIAGGN